MAEDKPTNVEVVDFRKKEGIENASERILSSAKANNVQFVDETLDIDSKLPVMQDEADFIDNMNEGEISMFREMAVLGGQIKKDLDAYQKEAEKNLKVLIDGDPEEISGKMVKQALYEKVDRNLTNRLCRNTELYDLLRKTMFWRIQERTGVFDYVLSVCQGYKVVKDGPVHLMQVEEATNRLKKLALLSELDKSNHPHKDFIRSIIESQF